MKIVVALDESASSDAVMEELFARSWPKDTEFQLISALDPFFFVKAPHLLEEAKKSVTETLHKKAAELEAAGWKASTSIVMENPRSGIADAARAWEPDLIMLGSHGRGAFQRFLIGSTARAVLRQAPCSVEIVRPRHHARHHGATKETRVLVPHRWIRACAAGVAYCRRTALAEGHAIQSHLLPGVSSAGGRISVLLHGATD